MLNFPASPLDGDIYSIAGRDYIYSESKLAWRLKNQITSSPRVYLSHATPTQPQEGDIWYDTTTSKVYLQVNGVWTQLNLGAKPPQALFASEPGFISVWDTNNPSYPDYLNKVILPTSTNGTYDCVVDWGDGVVESHTSHPIEHTYSEPGVYVINVSGQYEGVASLGSTAPFQLQSILQWGSDLRLGSEGGYFRDCEFLRILAQDTLNLEGCTTLEDAFMGCTNLTRIPNISTWDTSGILSLRNTFRSCTQYNDPEISLIDTSSVTDMSGTFLNCENFNQPLNSWNVGSVVDFSGMFNRCTSFNQPLNLWNLNSNNPISLNRTFILCKAFDQDISGWDTMSVYDMGSMFWGCDNFNRPLNSWDVSVVEDFSSMFAGCEVFNQPLNNWDTRVGEDFSSMFFGCNAFDQDLSSWRFSSDLGVNVNFSSMFSGCNVYNNGGVSLNSWNTTRVTDMGGMFFSCNSFNQPIGSWDVSNVSDFSTMFAGCDTFNQDISTWDVGNALDMSAMFFNASSFNQDLSTWDIANVEDFDQFLRSAISYSSLNYNSLLIGWASTVEKSNIEFTGSPNGYYTTEAADARAILTDTYNWVIEDGGFLD